MQFTLSKAVGSVHGSVPKFISLVLLVFFVTKGIYGQTNPAVQKLPYSQNFSGLAHSSTTYPDGWQGWNFSTAGSSTAFKLNAATGDQALTASGTTSTTSGGVHNFNGKIGFLATNSLDLGICLSIATTSLKDISISYDVMTIRNPFDGGSNTRINEVTLQYRVGTTGVFTSFNDNVYHNNTSNRIGSSETIPQNLQNRLITLPSVCNNQGIIQLRWVQRDVSGGGGRPSFAIDNISINGAAIFSTPMVDASPATSITAVSATLPGIILDDGAASVTDYGMEYSTTNNFAAGTGTVIAANNLSSTSFSVDLAGLSANTTYYYKAYATNSSGTAYSSQLSFTTAGLHAPQATAATNVTDRGFTANWNAVVGATGYRLDIATTPFTTATLTESFTTYTAGTTTYSGWVLSPNLGAYSSNESSSASGPNAVMFVSGGSIGTATSPLLPGPATELKFWLRNNLSSGSSMLVEGWNGDAWTVIHTISSSSVAATSGPSGGTQFTYHSSTTPALPGNLTQFRFTYTKSTGNFAFDDVSITYQAANLNALSAYTDLAVPRTSQEVMGLTPNTTYYYRVRAASANSTSHNSNTLSVTTAKSDQSITFDALAPKTYGDAVFTLNATASSGLAISYTSSDANVATISGNTVTITGAGTAIITVLQTGNGTFHAAANVAQTLTVDKATPIITWEQPAGITYGTTLSGIQLNAVANVAGTLTYAPVAGGYLNAGAGQTLSVNFEPEDKMNYYTASKEVAISVAPKTLTPVITVADKDYDGTTNAAITSRSFGKDEVVGSDEVSLGTSGTAVFANATAGEDQIVAITGLALSGANMSNYVLSAAPVTTMATIRKAGATISLSSLVYMHDGNAKAATATISPANISGVAVKYFQSNGGSRLEVLPANVKEVGSYEVEATLTNSNYKLVDGTGIDLSAKTGTLVIYAVPTVIITEPIPVAINTLSPIVANVTGVVKDPRWIYSYAPNTSTNGTIEGNQIKGAYSNSAAGVSTVYLEYKNAINETVRSKEVYVVFYNPDGGFVTGGGFIMSPQGAYKRLDDPAYISPTGKANFGFVSKYEKGAKVPSGNTQFQFQLVNMTFTSTAYEWLTVSGSRAQYKGAGKMNGAGDYGFLLTAVDGEVNGKANEDKFRIKIWDKISGSTVYDNQMSASDDAELTTITSGGSIVIHQPVKKSEMAPVTVIAPVNIVTNIAIAKKLSVKAIPNPSISQFNIKLESNNTNDAITLRVFNQLGQVVDVKRGLYSGQVIQVGAAYKQGTYFVEVVQGGHKKSLQMVKTN